VSGPSGHLGARRDRRGTDVDHDGDYWYVSGVSLVPYFEPRALVWKACGFWLDGVEELTAGGVDIERNPLDVGVDYSEYYADH
jgi:hypothetical protein